MRSPLPLKTANLTKGGAFKTPENCRVNAIVLTSQPTQSSHSTRQP
ncbi:MAG: hypothetical protein ABWU13_13630 [Limnospira maxima]